MTGFALPPRINGRDPRQYGLLILIVGVVCSRRPDRAIERKFDIRLGVIALGIV
jgi:hypothetical protein